MSLPQADVICSLLETPLAHWKKEFREDLFLSAQPTPVLHFKTNMAPDNFHYTFSEGVWYKRYSWLCGSHYKRRLFCWPCLLFSSGLSVWGSEGVSDSPDIERALMEHANTPEHVWYEAYLKNLAEPADKGSVDMHPAEHNEMVSHNRAIVKLAIDAVLYTNQMKTADFSENFEYFHQLFEIFVKTSPREVENRYSKLKCVLTKERMRSAQIEIMDCIAEHLRTQIQEEMIAAQFFAVQIDDITDINQKSACSMTVRYVTTEGQLVERFFGIHGTRPHLSAPDLVNLVEEELECASFDSKLVSLAHDSLILKDDQLPRLLSELRSKAPQVLVTNAHPLSTLLQQRCICRFKSCRLFFATIQRIPEFFKRAPRNEYSNLLVSNLEHYSEWGYHSGLFYVIVDRWDELKSTLEAILIHPEMNADCIYESKCFLNDMNDFEFTILCVLFRLVFHITDNLYYQLHCNSLDIDYCLILIQSKLNAINSIKCEECFQYVFETASSKVMPWKECGGPNVEDVKFKYKNLINEIINNILHELTIRFRELNKLRYFRLTNSSLFQTFTEAFPTEDVNAIEVTYPTVFDIERLTTELETFYNDHEYWNLKTYSIPHLMCKKNLHRELYRETYKLFVLVLTVHFSKPFSTSRNNLQKLKSYSGSGIPEDILCSLAYCEMNQPLCSRLYRETQSREDIVDRFFLYTLNDKDLVLSYKD